MRSQDEDHRFGVCGEGPYAFLTKCQPSKIIPHRSWYRLPAECMNQPLRQPRCCVRDIKTAVYQSLPSIIPGDLYLQSPNAKFHKKETLPHEAYELTL